VTRPRPFRRITASILAFGAASCLATPAASADLLVATSNAAEPIWHVDLDTGIYTPFLEGFGAQGMAHDAANQRLYFMTNTVTLWQWDYADAAAPVEIGNTTNPNASSPFLSLTGIGWSNSSSTLYGSRTLDSSGVPEGLFTIDTTTAVASLVSAYPDNNLDIGAFDVDPVTGIGYGFSDGNTAGIGIGLYQIDLATGGLTFLADAPAGSIPSDANRPDIDGLAVGGGKVYLVEDDAVQVGGSIYVYDLASGQYETSLQVPWFFNETFAGATWIDGASAALMIPEPAAAGGLLLAALGLTRRRRHV
jgi:hypothetical protein